MSIYNKYNTTSDKFNATTTGLNYALSLSELYKQNGKNTIYRNLGMFINSKGKFDDHPVIISTDFLVSIPSYLTKTVINMLLDDEVIDTCNSGLMGFKIREYVNSTGDTCTTVYWCEYIIQ